MEILKYKGADFLIKTSKEIGSFAHRNGLTEELFKIDGIFLGGGFYSSWDWLNPVINLIEKLNGKLECKMTVEIMELLKDEEISSAFKNDFRMFWSYIAVLEYLDRFKTSPIDGFRKELEELIEKYDACISCEEDIFSDESEMVLEASGDTFFISGSYIDNSVGF